MTGFFTLLEPLADTLAALGDAFSTFMTLTMRGMMELNPMSAALVDLVDFTLDRMHVVNPLLYAILQPAYDGFMTTPFALWLFGHTVVVIVLCWVAHEILGWIRDLF